MKERIIETAGKTWTLLGQRGEISVSNFPKLLKEKNDVALPALGWLAREDKINFATKNGRTFVSLVESEKNAFQKVNSSAPQMASKKQTKTKAR